MKKIIAVTIFLAATLSAFDYKDLPPDRFVTWKQAEITFPDATWDTVDVTSIGINPGNNINEKISEKLLNALKSKGTAKRVYYFPEGEYTFEAPILIGPNGYKAN